MRFGAALCAKKPSSRRSENHCIYRQSFDMRGRGGLTQTHGDAGSEGFFQKKYGRTPVPSSRSVPWGTISRVVCRELQNQGAVRGGCALRRGGVPPKLAVRQPADSMQPVSARKRSELRVVLQLLGGQWHWSLQRADRRQVSTRPVPTRQWRQCARRRPALLRLPQRVGD